MTRKEILEKTIDFDDAIHRIVRLEKENAELKELIKSEHEIEARKNNRLISRLTKAKEIIQLMLIYQEGLSSMGELKREAEQFISEVEKWKQ